MIRAAIGFFVLALVAYILGANGLAGLSMDIGRVLLVVLFVLAALAFVISFFTDKGTKQCP